MSLNISLFYRITLLENMWILFSLFFKNLFLLQTLINLHFVVWVFINCKIILFLSDVLSGLWSHRLLRILCDIWFITIICLRTADARLRWHFINELRLYINRIKFMSINFFFFKLNIFLYKFILLSHCELINILWKRK